MNSIGQVNSTRLAPGWEVAEPGLTAIPRLSVATLLSGFPSPGARHTLGPHLIAEHVAGIASVEFYSRGINGIRTVGPAE